MTGRPLEGVALVTGASAGIGAAFSRRLAAEGRDLVLVARDLDRLNQMATALRDRYPVAIDVLSADLATDVGCELVSARLTDLERPVDTLINNAGIGLYRGFGRSPLADEERLLNVNVRAVLRLTHAAANAMAIRGRGEIINVSSVAGFLPRGTAVTYAAAKAWVTSFSEGAAIAMAGRGVMIAAICPGLTHTEIHQRAGADISHLPSWIWLEADRVVAEGLADVRRGKVVSIPSRRYRLILILARLVPRPLLRRIMSSR